MRAELVEEALRNAAATARIAPDTMKITDRGGQSTSSFLRALVKRLGVPSSMGRTGVCWDDSPGETFFSALKNERLYPTVCTTKARAKRDVIQYIEGFYNSRRRHSEGNCLRPNEGHSSYQRPSMAA